jgi:tetratricopeptide (TPR) repeat protein
LNDDRGRGRVCALLTNTHNHLGELDEAVVSGSRAVEIAERLGDVRLRIQATTYLEQTHAFGGEWERAVELAADNLAALAAGSDYESFGSLFPGYVVIYNWHSMFRALAQLGRFAEAAPYEAEALRLAELTHHAYSKGMVHASATELHILKGEWATARVLIERGLAAFRMANTDFELSAAVASFALVLAQAGEASEALTRLRESEQLLDRDAAREFFSFHRTAFHSLGHACLLRGRLDEAQSLGDRAVEYSTSFPASAAYALHLLGDIATHPDRFDAARGEAHYRQALALAEPRGMRPLLAHCHLGLGKLYGRTGKHEQATEHLTSATTMYGEMGMTYWLEKTETAMSELS